MGEKWGKTEFLSSLKIFPKKIAIDNLVIMTAAPVNSPVILDDASPSGRISEDDHIHGQLVNPI